MERVYRVRRAATNFVFQDQTTKITYLSNLVETVYIKDIVERNKLKSGEGITELLRTLASSMGSPCNPRRISKTFESVEKKHVSSETVARHIRYFNESFLITEALRYDVKGRKYIGTETKYYFTDIGLRNSILGFRQIEETHIMENVLYNELKYRGYNVDVGMVEIMERNADGKQERKRLEVDLSPIKEARGITYNPRSEWKMMTKSGKRRNL